MKWLFLSAFLLFYLFFTLRARVLSKKIHKSIKAKDAMLDTAILATGLSAMLFLIELFIPSMKRMFLVLSDLMIFQICGLILIILGLLLSIVSSVSMGDSWRIGVDANEQTDLVSKGIYKISRNPYFVSYDLVLIGTIIASRSVVIAGVSIWAIIMFHILILKEEKYLFSIHGEKYAQYRAQVRRYL